MADEYDHCELCDVVSKTKQDSIFHYRSFGHLNKVLEQSKTEDDDAETDEAPGELMEIQDNVSVLQDPSADGSTLQTPELEPQPELEPELEPEPEQQSMEEDQNAAQTGVAEESTAKTTTNGSTSKASSPVIPLVNIADDSDGEADAESSYDATTAKGASNGTSSEAPNAAASTAKGASNGTSKVAASNARDNSYQIPDSMMSMMMDAWGRKSETFCEVCDLDCKSKDAYSKHLLGAKHKKKSTSKTNFKTGGKDQTANLEMQLTTLGEPIVGLECVQELVVSGGEMLYKCFLCGIASLTPNTMGPHLVCYKHRKAYLAFNYPDKFKKLENKNKRDSQEMVDSFALDIEETHGREHIVRAEEVMSAKVIEGLKKASAMLNVDDLGVNQLDDSSFYCEICDIATTSAGALAIHTAGSKHQKKAQNALRTGGNLESVTDGLEQNLSETAPGEAMIGLEFISEQHYVDATHDEIRYVCHLCDIDTLTVDAFSNHIISVRHRRRFMKICFPDKHTVIVRAGSKNSQQRMPAKRLAKEVESVCGRRRIVRLNEIINGVYPGHIIRLEQRKLELEMDKSDNILPPGVMPIPQAGVLVLPPSGPPPMGPPPRGPPPMGPPPLDPYSPLWQERDSLPPRRPDVRYTRRSRSRSRSPGDLYGRRSRSPRDRRRSRSPRDRSGKRPSPSSIGREVEPYERRGSEPYERRESDRESERLREERDAARRELDMLRGYLGKDSSASRDGVSMVSNVETKIYTAPNQPSVFERKVQEYRSVPTMALPPPTVFPPAGPPPAVLPPAGPPPAIMPPVGPPPLPYGGVRSGLPPVMMPTGPPPAAPPSIFRAQLPAAPPSAPESPKRDGYESVIPPLQSMEAFCDPAIKDGNPFTTAPRILNKMAEIMFLIKISPFPTYRFRDIAVDAFKQEDLKFNFTMNPATGSNHELLLTLEGIQIAKGAAAIVEVAQTQAFQIFVEKARESDYLIIEEGRSGKPTLRMFRSIISASSGAFRYDLLCKPRTRLTSELPVCEFCTAKGHIQQFCMAKKVNA